MLGLFLFPGTTSVMDEKEILQRQVDALEKLLQIKEAIIQEQESKIQKLENEAIVAKFPQYPSFPGVHIGPYIGPPQPPFNVPNSVPSVWTNDPCNDGGFHNYPAPWYGTAAPQCTKCGKMQHQSLTITCQDGTTTQLK